MKKLLFGLLCALSFGIVCLTFSGCFTIKISLADDGFAQREYDDNEKIAGEDRYSKGDAYTEHKNGRFGGTYEEFSGRKTISECPSKVDKEVSVELSLYTEKGKVKVVFVDAEDNVTTLLEYESGDTSGQYSKEITAAVKFLEGKNRFKIVGYDCEDLKVKLYYN